MNSRVETHNPSDDNCNISEHHLVMALGVFLVYMFPLLGNAIIYPWCDIGRTYRRIAQISLLLTGVWIVWFYGIQPHVSSFLRKFFFIGAHKTFVFSLLVITCLGIINSVKGTQVPMVFMLAKFLIAGFWVIDIDAVIGTDDPWNSEPVGDTQDGSEVSGVLDAVEDEAEVMPEGRIRELVSGHPDHSDDGIGVDLAAYLTELVVSDDGLTDVVVSD